MKHCPTCQRTFDDAMRFCQTDGTPLVEIIADNEVKDLYKTTVGRKDELTSAIPSDPFQTMISGMPKSEESKDSLQLSEDQDSLKTMFISDDELKREMSGSKSKNESIIDVPPLVNDSSLETEKSDSYNAPYASKFDEPSLNPPDLGNISSSGEINDSFSPVDKSNPFNVPASGKSELKNENSSNPFDNSSFNQPSPPIPAPFGDSNQSSFDAPSKPSTSYKEPEPLNYNQNDPFTSFGQTASANNQQIQQNEWAPPPAPEAGWRDQEIGANTPFQPPTAGVGQNQTLAIVSLVLGIIGIVLCQLTAPAALVTGFMARKKAEQNPSEYGGSGLALAGIIMGAIGTLLLALVIIYLIVVFSVVMNQGF